MIHELLLALSGYPGTIFTWNKRAGLQVKRNAANDAKLADVSVFKEMFLKMF